MGNDLSGQIERERERLLTRLSKGQQVEAFEALHREFLRGGRGLTRERIAREMGKHWRDESGRKQELRNAGSVMSRLAGDIDKEYQGKPGVRPVVTRSEPYRVEWITSGDTAQPRPISPRRRPLIWYAALLVAAITVVGGYIIADLCTRS